MAHSRTPRRPPRPVTPYSAFWPHALTRALAAVARGLPVFPLGPMKLPVVRSPHPGEVCRGECGQPGHGVHDATTDPERVRELFRVTPHATGYGIACGRAPEYLIGVDLDRKNGVDGVTALGDLARRHGFVIPVTVTVATPSGGVHLWLSGPADIHVSNSAGRIGPGIDVRGSGGYLVGPGSWTPNGAYRELPDRPQTAQPLPNRLLALLLPKPAPARPQSVLAPSSGCEGAGEALVRFVAQAPEGELNNRLFWAACRAWETGIGECLADALLAAACAAGHPERGAARTIASARTTAARRRGR